MKSTRVQYSWPTISFFAFLPLIVFAQADITPPDISDARIEYPRQNGYTQHAVTNTDLHTLGFTASLRVDDASPVSLSATSPDLSVTPYPAQFFGGTPPLYKMFFLGTGTPTADGTYTVRVTVEDSLLNTAFVDLPVLVDSTPPIVTPPIVIPPPGQTSIHNGDTFTVSGSFTDTLTPNSTSIRQGVLLKQYSASGTFLFAYDLTERGTPRFRDVSAGAFSVVVDMGLIGDFDPLATTAVLELWVDDGAQNRTIVSSAPFSVNQPEPEPQGPSNVLFLPGLKGSILKTGSDTLWPPTIFSNDLPRLALTEGGDSVNPVYVDGILLSTYGTDVYGPFATFMDGLVSDGTIIEWEPFAYDWRYSPEHAVEEGVLTETGTVSLIETVESLAASSQSGKVTIVSHSMGGLVGKALIRRLEAEDKDDLIDAFLMVGTPQLGTPQAIGSLLHGDDEGILGGAIVDASESRAIAQNMGSVYTLLPSEEYLSAVPDPVISFNAFASFTAPWITAWGSSITTYSALTEFLTGATVSRTDPNPETLRIPEILRADLLAEANTFHTTYDTYTFPDHIRVIEVVGWGVPTVKKIEYLNRHSLPSYQVKFTGEGDKTVVYPSATTSFTDDVYYYNLDALRTNEGISAQHKDLLNLDSVQKFLNLLLKDQPISLLPFLSETKPIPGTVANKLLVSAHSPVILGAYDPEGRFTGIPEGQDASSGRLAVLEDIPGSTFIKSAESQYIFLPKEGTYTYVFEGTGEGLATIDIENFSNDEATPLLTFTDILVDENTSARFVVDTNSPQSARIELDTTNDGQTDTYIPPDGASLTLSQLFTNLKTSISGLDIKPKLKNALIKVLERIEKKINKHKTKQATKILMTLEKTISTLARKGTLTDRESTNLRILLEQVERAL